MIKHFRQTGGFSLVQVMVAVFVLTLGMVSGASLLVSALISNRYIEDRLVATQLAQEGLEIVHNMRDTNYLTYAANARACWNFWDDTDEDGDVDGDDDACVPDASGQNQHPWGINDELEYIVTPDLTTFRWALVESAEVTNLGLSPYLHQHNALEVYTHAPNGATQSKFQRTLSFYYIDEDTTPFGDNPLTGGFYPVGENDKDNRILVVAEVIWNDYNNDHTVTLSTVLTDFYGREGWTE